MAIGDPFPGAGITNIIGQQGNPMGGVVESRSSNMFNPNETPEDAVLRLWQANAGIDQIAQLTGIPSPQIAQIINNYTGADTRMNNQFIQPLPAGAGVETEFEEEAVTELPFGQIDTEQITTRPDLISDGLGTQALMAMDSSLTENSPEVGEARNLEEKIIKTGTDVYGLNTEDPNVIQYGNVLSLDVLDGLQDDEEGISDDVKDQVLQDIGLNDVFTNENISMEDRIDFFKHYMAETLGLNYDDLKKSSDEGMPFLMAGAAMLQASKDGESRMAGFGKAMISFGTTKSQLARIADKEAAAYMMKAFDLGLEAHKMAQVGTGKMGATEWVTVPWSDDPILLPKETIVQGTQQGVKILPYSKDKDSKTTLYSIPKLTKDGVIYSYRKMTEPQYRRAIKELDSDLTAKGFTIKEATQGDRSKNILYTTSQGEREIMTLADYFAMPFDQQTSFESITGMNSVIDTTDGNKQKFVTDEELSTAPPEKYQSLNYGTYFESDGQGGFVFSTGGGKDKVLQGQTDRSIAKSKTDTREPLQEKIKQSKATFRLLKRSRGLAREGLFGPAAGAAGAIGNFIKSVEGVTNAYQQALDPAKRADYAQMKRDWYQEVANDKGFLNFVKRTGADKDRLMGTFWSLALASAQILNDQKGRDISNVDAERFLNRVGANSSSVAAVQMMLDDLESDLIHAQLDQYAIERSGLEAFPSGEKDENGNDIMKRILTDPGELFGPGGLVEEREAVLNAQLEELQVRRENAPSVTGEPIPAPKRPLSYTRLSVLLEEDVGQKGKGTIIVNPASKPDADVTWSTLAKIIYRDQFLGNETPDIRKAKVSSRLRDHFYNDPDAAREFNTWYNTIISR